MPTQRSRILLRTLRCIEAGSRPFAWPHLFKHGSGTVHTTLHHSSPLTASPILFALALATPHCTMRKSRFSVPVVGGSGPPSGCGSWRRHRRSPGHSTSTTVAFSENMEIFISNDDEQEKLPRLYTEAAVMDDEYQWQMELMIKQSLWYRGPVLPSPPRA